MAGAADRGLGATSEDKSASQRHDEAAAIDDDEPPVHRSARARKPWRGPPVQHMRVKRQQRRLWSGTKPAGWGRDPGRK
jgi:hypothetical protein